MGGTYFGTDQVPAGRGKGMRLLDRGCRLSRFEENRTVKRTVFIAAGMMALAVAIYVGKLWAQTTGHPAPAPQSKVALVNLSYVIKNYEKWKAFQAEAKGSLAKYEANDAQWKAEGEKLAKELQQPTTTPDRRDQIESTLRDLKRKLDDNKAEATKLVNKKQEQQIVVLYSDIRTVVARVAQSRGYEMVFHFHDATTTQEFWGAQNIARKMQAPFMPMYYHDALDVSADVVTTLNSAYKTTAPRTPTAPAATGTR
jgi:Skp family chaperone for outer membrane proteins